MKTKARRTSHVHNAATGEDWGWTVPPFESGTEAVIGKVEATIKQIESVLSDVQSSSSNRDGTLQLRIASAWLEGLSAPEVAQVLGFSDVQFRKALHGNLKVQRSKWDRIEAVTRITRTLRETLEADAVGDWYRTPIPRLKGRTPIEALRKGQAVAVEKVVQSYLDTTYG